MLTILLLYLFSLKREARVTGNVEFLQGKKKKFFIKFSNIKAPGK
jgi:hypothetical protein